MRSWRPCQGCQWFQAVIKQSTFIIFLFFPFSFFLKMRLVILHELEGKQDTMVEKLQEPTSISKQDGHGLA